MTEAAWELLRAECPWPAAAPDVAPDLQGFFDAENISALRRAIALAPTPAPLILELGTWKGTSAHWMLSSYPEARVICVDLWRPAETYPEHGKWGWLAKEPHVYETCQHNLWSFRDRCLLVKARTIDGLALVAACGLKPDVVYIDAGHTYEAVSADVRGTLERFPDAIVLGDDFNQAPVRQAVQEVAPAFARIIADEHTVWRLVRAKTKWGDYPLEYGRLVAAGQVVFDVGAEYGTTAQYFLARGAARVFVSEIEPSHRARLHRAAVADPRLVLLPPLQTPREWEAWMARHAPSRVKMDIEGGEVHLLTCSAAAFRTPAAYALETHTPALHAALLARFAECGYRVTLTRAFASNPKVKVIYAEREADVCH